MADQQPQVTNILKAIISSIDIESGEPVIVRDTGEPAILSQVGTYIQKFRTLAAGADTQLPISNGSTGTNGGDQLYIKNTDKNAILTVKWNSGGGVISVIPLRPGGQIILWQAVQGNQVGSVSVASDVGATFCEVFQGIIAI